jgi:hypothetical protein
VFEETGHKEYLLILQEKESGGKGNLPIRKVMVCHALD